MLITLHTWAIYHVSPFTMSLSVILIETVCELLCVTSSIFFLSAKREIYFKKNVFNCMSTLIANTIQSPWMNSVHIQFNKFTVFKY